MIVTGALAQLQEQRKKNTNERHQSTRNTNLCLRLVFRHEIPISGGAGNDDVGEVNEHLSCMLLNSMK
jgi:hypothetical protein